MDKLLKMNSAGLRNIRLVTELGAIANSRDRREGAAIAHKMFGLTKHKPFKTKSKTATG